MAHSTTRAAVVLSFAIILFSLPAPAEEPFGVELLRPDSLAGWDHGEEPITGWTILDGRLSGGSDSSPLLSGWSFGDFELRFHWSVRDGSAWRISLPEVPVGKGLELILREGNTCGQLLDGDKTLAGGGKVDSVEGKMHTAAIRREADERSTGQAVFDYLLVGRDGQIEAERVAIEHLRRLGALVEGPFAPYAAEGEFPVEASVVIPVRNRVRTVAEAVRGALAQRADFAFNVIVVDNHSTDGTTPLLAEIAAEDPRLVHVIPERNDLGIGGCWNEAVFHPSCGRYACQLDSDDLYDGADVLARVVGLLRTGCGMVIGSYTTVDFDLNPLPPGLIDHAEWTDDNGPNNALRIDGLGAPRCFATGLLRASPFPNVSYGEDYAVALRISREYKVGRIYDSLYWCRRWEDNTDASLAPAAVAGHQTFKDRIRTLEIAARCRLNEAREAGR